MKSTPKSSSDSSRSSGGRGAAGSGNRKASNVHAALRQSEKSGASKACNRRDTQGGEKSSTPRGSK